jgi:hypothetical protein
VTGERLGEEPEATMGAFPLHFTVSVQELTGGTPAPTRSKGKHFGANQGGPPLPHSGVSRKARIGPH